MSLGFEEESYTVTEGGVLEMVIFKSLPCDFNIHFQVRADGIIDQELVLKSPENETMISVTLPDDDVALEPDENHMLILSLSVPDPQVELGTHISSLTITDDDSKYSTKELLFIVHTAVPVLSCNFSSFSQSATLTLCAFSSVDQVTVGFKERSTTVREDSGSIQISVGPK